MISDKKTPNTLCVGAVIGICLGMLRYRLRALGPLELAKPDSHSAAGAGCGKSY